MHFDVNADVSEEVSEQVAKEGFAGYFQDSAEEIINSAQTLPLFITVNRRLAEFTKQRYSDILVSRAGKALSDAESDSESGAESGAANDGLSHSRNDRPYQSVAQTVQAMTLNDWWQAWTDMALISGVVATEELPNKVLSDFEAQWFMEQSLQQVLKRSEQAFEAKANRASDDSDLIGFDTAGTEDSSGQEYDGLFADTQSWQEISLLNISNTAKKLYQAYAMAEEYLPEEWHQQQAFGRESQLLLAVKSVYLQRLAQKKFLDPVLLQQRRLNWLQRLQTLPHLRHGLLADLMPQNVQLLGFDEVAPFIKQWQSLMQSLGCVCQLERQVELKADALAVSTFTAVDPQQEVQQVCRWALAFLVKSHEPVTESDGNKSVLDDTSVARAALQSSAKQRRIGIVAPDLQLYKGLIQSTLDEQALVLGVKNLNLQEPSSNRLYNLSLGESLLQLEMVQNALLSARLFMDTERPIQFKDWTQWLCSPYTLGGLSDRQALDQQIRRLQWSKFGLQRLLQEADVAQENPSLRWPNGLAALKSALLQLSALKKPQKMTLSGFMQRLKAVVDLVGWPGSRTLSSMEYQQKEAFEAALNDFSELIDMGSQHYTQWLKLLTRFLGEQIHQPQSSGNEPIQIMGMLEAAGQEFDALWVLGMSDSDWPRAAQPNPFLPMSLQLEYQLPRADASRELNYAKQVTQRLLQASPKLWVSYSQYSNEQENLFSPLMASSLQTLQPRLAAFNHMPTLPYQSFAELRYQQRKSAPQWLEDSQGEALQKGVKAPGGTGILQAQSRCPLMAYIDYRLGAKYGFQEVEESLQQHNQGTLIHRVLELFWLEHKNLKTVQSRTPDALEASLQATIERVYAEALARQAEEPLIQLEKQRVLALCLQWLQMEQEREPFAVIQTEKAFEIGIAGITFKVVVDRIDATDSGLMVIDYKTGKASINDLFPKEAEAIRAPQLATYLFAIELLQTHLSATEQQQPLQSLAGLGYGILHSDDGVKLNAVVEGEAVLGENMTKSRSIMNFAKECDKEDGAFAGATWQDLLNSLRSEVEKIAQAIQLGQAQMQFQKTADLAYSPSLLALRLPEVIEQQTEFELLQAQDERQLSNASKTSGMESE